MPKSQTKRSDNVDGSPAPVRSEQSATGQTFAAGQERIVATRSEFWTPEKINDFLDHNGLTRQQLANMIGVKPTQIRDWQVGRSVPSRGMQDRLDSLELPKGWPPHRITALRNATGLSMYAFAWEVGVAPFTVWAWESGKQEPSLANCVRLDRMEKAIDGRTTDFTDLSPTQKRNLDVIKRVEQTGNASLVAREFGISRERVRQIVLKYTATGEM
jgi:DNA-binding transcriptional regulator YiaG/ribosomal protein S14